MPLKIPYYEMDIPRLVTALADWLACLLYLRFLPPRYGGVKRAALYGGALAALALYLVATDGFNGWRFNVLYAVSVALMLLFMAAATRADRWQVGYFCTRAFILRVTSQHCKACLRWCSLLRQGSASSSA